MRENNRSKRQRWFAVVMLVFLFGAFLFGIVSLFTLRFETGDIYPPYSSLRADPLGTKAFYEALESLPGITIRRNYQSHQGGIRPREEPAATLFYLGLSTHQFTYADEDVIGHLESLVNKGGRLVISFSAIQKVPSPKAEKEQANPRNQLGKELSRVSLGERWGVDFGYKDLEASKESNKFIDASKRAALSTEDSIACYTVLYFDKLVHDWRVVYARDEYPVLIERRLGEGTLVLSADSYLLSNEAMWDQRYPRLLAWLVGANKTVIFDESHLGLADEPGVASLARKYRLHGLLAGLLFVAILFIWKNSVCFLPPEEESIAAQTDQVSGKDYMAGFVNLLRRSIPARNLLPVCYEEWHSSVAHARKDLAGKLEAIEKLITAENTVSDRHRNPVRIHNEISRILSERK